MKDPASRLVRWRLKLMEYDFDIIYKAGKSIPHVDVLSRIPHDPRGEANINVVNVKEAITQKRKLRRFFEGVTGNYNQL